jgi:uncharacterized protein (TIGR03663 family)
MDLKAKIKHHWPAFLILLVAAVARLTLLSIKPPHFDEGVNGWFVDQMTLTGFYHYDPTNYHGPFHFYVLFLMQTLFGRHIWALRLPLALMSLATVALTIRFDRFIGRGAALWAAAAMAISPGCVFYGRYAIHEYWLVFSLMLGAWGLAGLWQSGERKYLWAVWIAVTGAVLTKETYVIHFATCALTLPCVWLIGRLNRDAPREATAPQQWTAWDMALGALLFLGCVLFFYSGGFMDIKGLAGLYQCFAAWFQTGKAGNGHEKVWFYWIELFGRYEWPSSVGLAIALLCLLPRTPRFVWGLAASAVILWLGWCHIHHKTMQWALTWPYLLPCAAFLFTVVCATPRLPRFIRALAIYGVGALVAYSIVHYKTPWCIVSLTWPFLILFGWGVDLATRKFGIPVAAVAAALLIANTGKMVRLNFFRYTNPRESYVYVQTFNDVNLLMDPLNALVARDPAGRQLSGNIIMESYHPLPWLLGDFSNIGYYDENTTPSKMDADFLLVDESRIDEVEKALHGQYFTKKLRLRDAMDPAELYLSVEKFRSIFPGRKPGFIPPKNPAPAPAPGP